MCMYRCCTAQKPACRRLPGALSQRAGHLLVAWGRLACPHCSTAWPVHPRDGAGVGQKDAIPLMSFPPPRVFLIIKLRTSDVWSPPGKQSQATPQSSSCGGFTRARCRVWAWVRDGGLRRGCLKNVSYIGKQKRKSPAVLQSST